MIDEHCSTELMVDDLDDAMDEQTTVILEFPPPIPTFGPAPCQARAQRRRCVRRQYRRRGGRARHHRHGASLVLGLLLISGVALCLGLVTQLS